MEACFAAAEKQIERQSVCALAALAPPEWTKSVIGTAAAMILETSRPMCAKQLIQEVKAADLTLLEIVDDVVQKLYLLAAANSKHAVLSDGESFLQASASAAGTCIGSKANTAAA